MGLEESRGQRGGTRLLDKLDHATALASVRLSNHRNIFCSGLPTGAMSRAAGVSFSVLGLVGTSRASISDYWAPVHLVEPQMAAQIVE